MFVADLRMYLCWFLYFIKPHLQHIELMNEIDPWSEQKKTEKKIAIENDVKRKMHAIRTGKKIPQQIRWNAIHKEENQMLLLLKPLNCAETAYNKPTKWSEILETKKEITWDHNRRNEVKIDMINCLTKMHFKSSVD